MKTSEANLLSETLLGLSIQAQELEKKLSELEELKSKIIEKDELIDRLKIKISQVEASNSDLKSKITDFNDAKASTSIIEYSDEVVYGLLDKLYLHVPDDQVSAFSSEITRLLTLNEGLADHPTVVRVLQGSVIQDALVLSERLEYEGDCIELESQLSNFSNQRSLLANCICMFLILKNMSISNLYKILFTSLFYENFRLIVTIKDVLFAKMLDMQLMGGDFKHPILWSFGPNYSTKKALNYLNSLLFNVTKLPCDPMTGDNIWHYIAKDKSEDIISSIKKCNIHTEALEIPNKQGITPMELVPQDVHHDVSQCLIMKIASDGAEYYKSGDYNKALELYSKALDKQIALSCEYTNKLSDKDKLSHNTNIGKLLYNKARSLMHLKRWTESITTCELCIAYLPRYGNAYETIIQASDSLLDWEKGLDVCIEYQVTCGVDLHDKREFFNAQLNATAFQILQVPVNASQKLIKQSFNNLCKVWHPDKIHENDDLKRRSTMHFNRLFKARQLLMDDETRMIELGKPETNYTSPNPTFKSNDEKSFSIDMTSKLHFEVMMQTQSVGVLEMSGKKGSEIDDENIILSNLQSKLMETVGRKAEGYVDRSNIIDNLRSTHIRNDDSHYRVDSIYEEENFRVPNFPPNFQNVHFSGNQSNVFKYNNSNRNNGFWKTNSARDIWSNHTSRIRESSSNIRESNDSRNRTSSVGRVGEFNNSTGIKNTKNHGIPTSKIRPLGFKIYSTVE